MADISKINALGTTYNIKDEVARTKAIKNETEDIVTAYFGALDYSTSGNEQGMCIDSVNNKMYLYYETSYPAGAIDVINLATGAIDSTISITGYHGNSLCLKNNKIYIATTKDVSHDLVNTDIVVYDLTTNTSSVDKTFSGLADFIWGIANYDENNLLIGLANYDDKYNHAIFYLYNITNHTYKLLTTNNTNNIHLDYIYHQDMKYLDNHLFILTSEPNMIIDCLVDENSVNVNKIYGIPYTDSFGQTSGELESFDVYSLKGNGTFLLYGKQYNRQIQKTICNFDLINPFYGMGISYNKEWIPNYLELPSIELTFDNTYNNLYKYGTTDKPFSTSRQCVNFKKYNKFGLTCYLVNIKATTSNFDLYERDVTNLIFNHESSVSFNSINLGNCSNIRFYQRQSPDHRITVNSVICNGSCSEITFVNITSKRFEIRESDVYLNTCVINAEDNNYLFISRSKVYLGVTINKTTETNAIENFSVLITCPYNFDIEDRADYGITASCSIINSSI